MEHALSSLSQIFSFSHHACDAILQSRGIEVVNAYSPQKHEDDVYLGFIWLVCWLAVVVVVTIRAWFVKKPSGNYLTWRYGGFIFTTFGLVCLSAQLSGMVAYVDTCRTLLSGQTAVPSQVDAFGSGILVLLMGVELMTAGTVLLVRPGWYTYVQLREQEERPAFVPRIFRPSLDGGTARRNTYFTGAMLWLVGWFLFALGSNML